MRPQIYLVDLDGTLALKDMGAESRDWLDWHRVQEDCCNPSVVWTVRVLSRYHHFICMTARDEVCREQTMHWLKFAGLEPLELLMRPAGDSRPDQIIKRDLYERHIRGVYDVIAVFEDRDAVVKMWREEVGLTVFQVAYGNY